jgi:hypothetical protein
MVNMMSTEKLEDGSEPVERDAPKYPYGLEISLNHESMTKLGLDKAPPMVGQFMTLTATVKVTSCRAEEEREGGTRLSTELQITDMEIAPAKAEGDAKTMYPNSNMK